MTDEKKPLTRRQFIAAAARGTCAAALVGVTAYLARNAWGATRKWVWQLDPSKCTQCGKCSTSCVLQPSAVKCIHGFYMCGYCDFCTGFLKLQPNARNAGAENQLCPVGAIRRRYIDKDPYFEYTIDESLCIGCARCVKGCADHGNGSLFLQVRHDRCLNCNECAIAAACPSDAFVRRPFDHPYLLKGKDVKR